MSPSHRKTTSRGRRARTPEEIPKLGLLDVGWRVIRAARRNRLTMLAAGVAFYALLALFPTIAAVISLWGLLFDPVEAGQQLYEIGRFIPGDAANLIDQQADQVIENTEAGNFMAAMIGLAIAMFVASKGVAVLVVGLNVVYGESEKRPFLHRTVLLTALTLGLIVMTLVSLGFIALIPMVVDMLTIEPPVDQIIKWLRWPALLIMMSFLISLLYRFAPYRRKPRWVWINYGTLFATVTWLLGSAVLSLYVRYFTAFSDLYGSLGAVVALMIWFWLSAFIVLFGAELNCELERQTLSDTTVGRPRPLGHREAFAADTVGVTNPLGGDGDKRNDDDKRDDE
ncbi:YihY/virulence factor BrkB family protein [Halomonas sp. 707D4]|uniref:YihY/virulence factor BrkB family protein n=2 Tax=unclassified Halomonas TaxID=2609666 RepID=UPI00209DCE98|nr:YihY/virulence factor BrkB family protein [Halomonas sp. 707D4]MCP1326648.1 YihY/virulence factor BrkB family protein [Halomonas sp. 707D4]